MGSAESEVHKTVQARRLEIQAEIDVTLSLNLAWWEVGKSDRVAAWEGRGRIPSLNLRRMS